MSKEFRKEMFKNLKKVKTNKNQDRGGFAIVSLEILEKHLRKKTDLTKKDIEEHFEEIRDIINTPNIHKGLKGKALHYLGKFEIQENKDILINALSSDDLFEVKNAGRGIRSLIKFAEQSDKEALTENLISALEKRKG